MLQASAQRIPFRKTDKTELGTFVLYSQLPELFPSAALSINHTSPNSALKYNYDKNQGYFIVSMFVDMMETELDVLKTFVDNGNVVFISTYYLDKRIEDWLGVKVETDYDQIDSIGIFDTEKMTYTNFYVGKRAPDSYITGYDSAGTDYQVIGKTHGKANCISFKKGEGYVVLHTQPFMLSNYHLIKKKTKAYSEILFSSMPGPVTKIYWDEYSKGSGYGGDPLKFIKSEPALWYAFLLSLLGLLLLVLFAFKRRQRVIPLSTPLANTSLDMARTVSDMYYFGKRNEVMAKKKIAHWLEFLRTKYNIFTSLSPDVFWNAVELRSGMETKNVASLRNMVERFRNGEQKVSDIQLIHLNNLIDSFYKS